MMTEEELSDKCWDTIKEMASSYQTIRNKRVKKEEEEDSAMAVLMRSTDEEIEKNCKLARDVTESQRESKKRETVLKFEELFEKWKGR